MSVVGIGGRFQFYLEQAVGQGKRYLHGGRYNVEIAKGLGIKKGIIEAEFEVVIAQIMYGTHGDLRIGSGGKLFCERYIEQGFSSLCFCVPVTIIIGIADLCLDVSFKITIGKKLQIGKPAPGRFNRNIA